MTRRLQEKTELRVVGLDVVTFAGRRLSSLAEHLIGWREVGEKVGGPGPGGTRDHLLTGWGSERWP